MVSILDEANINKIGYNTIENVPHFHYDSKPILMVISQQDKRNLEYTAAIRRCDKRPQSQK